MNNLLERLNSGETPESIKNQFLKELSEAVKTQEEKQKRQKEIEENKYKARSYLTQASDALTKYLRLSYPDIKNFQLNPDILESAIKSAVAKIIALEKIPHALSTFFNT